VRLGAAGVLTILLVSPQIPVLLEQHAAKVRMDLALSRSHHDPGTLSFAVAGQGTIESEGPKSLAKSAAVLAGFYPARSLILLALCSIPLAAALMVTGYLGLVKGDEVCRLFALVVLAVGIGAVALHLFRTRYMLPLVPHLVLAVARAIQHGTAKPKLRVASLAVGTLILCQYAAGFSRQTPKGHGHPWQDLVSTLQQNYRSGEPVVFDALYSEVPFDYFARHKNFQPQETGFPLSVYDWWDQQEFEGWGGPVILRSDLDQYMIGLSASKPKSLWLVRYEACYYDPHDAFLERLRQLGQVTEIRLPPDSDNSGLKQALRLFRISAY